MVASRVVMLRTFLALLFFAGCCAQAEDCPDQTIVILVTEGGAPVEGVTASGDLEMECNAGETETTCAPTSRVPAGDYAITVEVPGHPPSEVTLEVRANSAPPFSCECEVREASATIELDPPAEMPDGGA